MTMTFGSLFTGFGGMDLGLERAGMECVWQVENDPYCQRVLAKHWLDLKRLGDVRDCGKHNLEWVDGICGGPPCQPVSCAGKRKGDTDKRWLWPEFYRIICELRPRWVLVENVPGLLSMDAGRLFGGILRDLAASGYDAEWDCIPAAAFGAPHIRYRVFLLAYANGRRFPQCPELNSQTQQDSTDGHSQRQHSDRRGDDVAYAECTGLEIREGEKGLQEFAATVGAGQWATEPDVDRVAHGVPARVDRLRGLGNAVVPQAAEWFGRRIVGNYWAKKGR